MRLLLIVYFLSSSYLMANNFDNSLVESKFYPGLPKEITFKWECASYARINSGIYFKALYLVSKDSLKTSKEFFLFVIKEDGFSYSTTTFKNNETIINLTTSDEDLLSPLKIIIDQEKGVLFYKWENNSNDSEMPTVIKEYELKVGKRFPIIKLETPNGIWTNENKNKIIVINWWATSCRPCIEEIPGLNKLVEKHINKEIEFIGIVWDKENHAKFIEKFNFNYNHCFSDTSITLLLKEVFPRNIIVDKNGLIIYNRLGGNKDTFIEIDKALQNISK